MPSEDRLALVGAEEEDGWPVPAVCATSQPPASRSPPAALPWICSLAYRCPRPTSAAVRATTLNVLLAALSSLLLVQLALLRDASRAAGVGAYPSAVTLSMLAAAAAAPAAAVALWRGGRPAPPGWLTAAAGLCSVGGLLVLAGRHRNRLGCNVQDPLVAVVIVFAFIGHLLTTSELRLRSIIAQVTVCVGLFIGVSYQACNKYRCHGDDHSAVWRPSGAVDSAEGRSQHVLWVAAGAAGLAMVCGAALLLELHFHGRRRGDKGGRSSWWDDVASTALMTSSSFLVITLLFWIDLVPGIGESASAQELGGGLLKAFAAIRSESPHFRRACLIISATCPCLTLIAVRLLSAGRPTFQLATLVTLGVLISELWWSVSRIDGAGGWTPQARLTGEAVMAVVGGVMMIAGLVAWLSFGEKKQAHSSSDLAVCEFEVYKVQSDNAISAVKYRWPQQDVA